MAKPLTEPIHKVIGVPLSKTMSKQADGTLSVRGYFTSDNKDMVGDIITRAATERAIPAYRQWGNIRYMHLPRPVAKVVAIGAQDGLAWNEVEIRVIDPQAVFEVEQGLLSALSVGILIQPEDVDFLETGGLIINDYKLAEISLVDHPANYDARLKTFSIEQGLSVLAGHYGINALARGMQSLIETEMMMEDETSFEEIPAVETLPEVEPEIEPTPEPVEPPGGELPVEPPVPMGEVEPEVVTAAQFEEIKDLMVSMAEMVKSLADSFANLSQTLATEPEEALSAGPAANRKSAGQETVLPGSEDEPVKGAEVSDLRDALTKYFSQRR